MLSFYHFEKLLKRMMYNLCMDIRNYIANYKPYNEQEANDQKQMLKWIDTGLDLFTRKKVMNGLMNFVKLLLAMSTMPIILSKKTSKASH